MDSEQQVSHWSIPKTITPSLLLKEGLKGGKKLLITHSVHEAQLVAKEYLFFSPDEEVIEFTDRETLPYDYFSPHEDLTSDRLSALNKIKNLHSGIIVTSIQTLMSKLPPISHVVNGSINIRVGSELSLEKFKNQLISMGYNHSSQVWHHGEFSSRGAIVDLFPMGESQPIRIEWFDNCVESLRRFDRDSQKSQEKLTSFNCHCAHEYSLTKEAISLFRKQWRGTFTNANETTPAYEAVSQGRSIAGLESYLPLFFTQLNNFFDFCPNDLIIIHHHDILKDFDIQQRNIEERYEQLRHNTERPLLKPDQLYITQNELNNALASRRRIIIHDDIGAQSDSTPFKITPIPSIDKEKNNDILKMIKNHMEQTNDLFFICDSLGRRDLLSELLTSNKISHFNASNWQQSLESKQRIALLIGPLETGFFISDKNTSIITERELTGQPPSHQKRHKKTRKDPANIIKNLLELQVGSIIVHMEYGIGRYLGLNKLTIDNIESEFITLEYADDNKVYIPITDLHVINRYSGNTDNTVSLSKLGSNKWQKAKEKIARRVRDIAAELLLTQSKRKLSKGFQFKKPNKEFSIFRNEFSYIETPDQQKAIEEVINDMTNEQPMDRLVCGDVGFGKTEVAMQASFLCCYNNKQSAILVPTTLLAQQHYHSFLTRFSNWPIKIAMFTRLQSEKEQETILSDLRSHKIDLIIGTHKLLSDRVTFKDLGLLVIDEEQRFGVRHKNKIKQMAHHVDLLTLSATPIPRTLNMSLVGTKDLSIIATPPERRLSVKTFVHEKSSSIIKEAITREINRGGQVFYLHNNIKTMNLEYEQIKKIAPQVNVILAHGQMNKNQLESIMSDFYHQKYNLLLTTTIIESGIDIPTANTIIINRADRFGLSQLHQLRGRVGRSHHQAYAYLFTPHKSAVSTDAKKRLEAIETLEELGSGFMLATHDMEIRGVGEILGEKQSGSIDTVGFSLFMDMLDESIKSLNNGSEPNFDLASKNTIKIDLGESTLLPSEYIGDVNIRLNLYKRLSDINETEDLKEFKVELIDRFGQLPQPAENLLLSAELTIFSRKLGISIINFNKVYIHIEFNQEPNIQPSKLIQLIQSKPQQYQLLNNNTIRLRCDNPNIKERVNIALELLYKIKSPNCK
jgi:transcription-repair coupling factor (superfamily II helicase)